VNEGPASLEGRRGNRKGRGIYVEGGRRKERKMREAGIDGK